MQRNPGNFVTNPQKDFFSLGVRHGLERVSVLSAAVFRWVTAGNLTVSISSRRLWDSVLGQLGGYDRCSVATWFDTRTPKTDPCIVLGWNVGPLGYWCFDSRGLCQYRGLLHPQTQNFGAFASGFEVRLKIEEVQTRLHDVWVPSFQNGPAPPPQKWSLTRSVQKEIQHYSNSIPWERTTSRGGNDPKYASAMSAFSPFRFMFLWGVISNTIAASWNMKPRS